jgi:hypothetical protein
MIRLQPLMWMAGAVQALVVAANFVLPGLLRYRDHLRRLPGILRQVFIVHSCYIVAVILFFATATFAYPADLASGHGLGRFMSAVLAVFWLARVPLQLFYYDPSVRRSYRLADITFIAGILFVGSVYTTAALQGAF